MLLDSWSDRRRDALFVAVAVLLLCAPLTTLVVHADQPRYRYERVEVTTENGLGYENEDAVPRNTPLSSVVRCAVEWTGRVCAFERTLLDNETVPSGSYTNNPDMPPELLGANDPYEYVVLNETVYEATYLVNTSAPKRDGLWRVEMRLARVDPETTLDRLSDPVESDSIPSLVETAAKTGASRSPRKLTPDATPIEVGDGTYYRVYRADRIPPNDLAQAGLFVVAVGFPLVGILILRRVAQRIDVTHTG